MYLALWVFLGILLSVPVSAVALLAEVTAERYRSSKSGKQIRRSVALALAATTILALAIPGAGLHTVAFLFPLCLAIGCVAGYVVIERLVKR